jgi:hypothetical protein
MRNLKIKRQAQGIREGDKEKGRRRVEHVNTWSKG